MRRMIGEAAILVLATAACGGSGGGSPAAPSAPAAASTPAPAASATPPPPAATTAPASDLTGTWRGGGARFTLVWQLTQQGGTVTGVSQYVDGHGVMSDFGRVTGTVSGDQFSFRDEYRPGPSGCNEDDTGTLTIQGNRMSGLFVSTTDCSGTERGDLVLQR